MWVTLLAGGALAVYCEVQTTTLYTIGLFSTVDHSSPSSEQRNGRIFVTANGLQNIGDQITAAKTVLPWIFAAAGTPAVFTAFLVPIRESGSMLPQAALTPWILSRKKRVPIWVAGSAVQAVSAAGIGLSALFLSGVALGIAVIVCLAALALGRSLCSITSKDVQGRVISKGKRGDINGKATALGGAVGIAVAIVLILLGDAAPPWALAALILASAAAWFIAGVVFNRIEEPSYAEVEAKKDPQDSAAHPNPMVDCFLLLRDDKDFRNFVLVRSLLLVTALSTAFLVTLGANEGASFGAGLFMLANGLAGFLGGRVSGKLSDVSSRNVMSYGSLIASVVLLATVAASYVLSGTVLVLLLGVSFFLVSLAHVAVRVARKTYVVDMAEGDERTRIVGAANTLMGIFLLVTGALSGALAYFGPQAALIFLAVMGIVGTLMARSMRDVSVA